VSLFDWHYRPHWRRDRRIATIAAMPSGNAIVGSGTASKKL